MPESPQRKDNCTRLINPDVVKARNLEEESQIVRGLARIAAEEGRHDMARMRAADAAQCLCFAAEHCTSNGEIERAETLYRESRRLREEYR